MYYRVLIAIPEGPYAPPRDAVIASGHIDYIVDVEEEIPEDALYVAQMNAPGEVSIVKQAPEGFEHGHTFSGWPPVYRLG